MYFILGWVIMHAFKICCIVGGWRFVQKANQNCGKLPIWRRVYIFGLSIARIVNQWINLPLTRCQQHSQPWFQCRRVKDSDCGNFVILHDNHLFEQFSGSWRRTIGQGHSIDKGTTCIWSPPSSCLVSASFSSF